MRALLVLERYEKKRPNVRMQIYGWKTKRGGIKRKRKSPRQEQEFSSVHKEKEKEEKI